jgi:RNA polymerase sigma factor (sigma-70 family)
MQGGTAAVERVFREEYGRLIASLARRFGDIDIAEEAAGEALVAALERWPESGVPPNPGGWLTTTAGNRAIDRIRRENQRDAKHQAAFMYYDDTPHEPTGPVGDDRLRLLFTCCHPSLAPEARIALTLRLLGGLTVPEIAQAFLVPETTMAQRITRAKKKIASAKVPYRVPEAADLPERLGGVLAVLFLVFNEGYLATGDGDPVRAELTGEAIRLTRILRQLLPEEPEVAGLLGLLVLTEARREAREGAVGVSSPGPTDRVSEGSGGCLGPSICLTAHRHDRTPRAGSQPQGGPTDRDGPAPADARCSRQLRAVSRGSTDQPEGATGLAQGARRVHLLRSTTPPGDHADYLRVWTVRGGADTGTLSVRRRTLSTASDRGGRAWWRYR